MQNFDAVLLLGHGSRIEEANRPLFGIADLVGQKCGCEVRAAFLQMATPGLGETLAELVAGGKKNIVVVPFFLYPGAHVLEDIPHAIDDFKRAHPGVEVTLGGHLGVHPLMADIVLERIKEVTK